MKKLRIIYEDFIRKQYQKIRRKEPYLHSYQDIQVKKGKIKYTLLILETVDGQMQINLGRHIDKNEDIFQLTK